MPRMIELMRQSSVPANVMRSAARGALALPPAEMIEILVYLTNNPVFAEQAKMTLAGWDETSSLLVAGDPNAPKEVLEYLVAAQNRRPRLIPTLLENPAIEEKHLLDMAQTESRELVDMLLASPRVRKSSHVLHALAINPHVGPEEAEKVQQALRELGVAAAPATEPAVTPAVIEALDEETAKYLAEHAAEIAAEEGKGFSLVGAHEDREEAAAIAAANSAAPAAAEVAPAAPAAAAAPAAETAAAAAVATQKVVAQKPPEERERISVIQKIARLTVGERVQLAMKGTKDERFVLIRDGSKVVSSAVLESPKVSDAEIETFAAMKNVQESVLRGITMHRKFMKNYAVVRALVNNPRLPLDLGLSLMNHLLVNDLKGLSMNKNISETLRKMALKTYKQKSAPPGSKPSG